MNIAKIRFKGTEWEHNPESLTILNEENINEVKLLNGKSFPRKLSAKCRVVKGKGKLTGYNCLEKFNELLKLQSEGTSGILTLPKHKPFLAFLKKLELICEPVPDAVEYRFEFIEDSGKNNLIKEKRYHTVLSGETLWDISYRYGETVQNLVKLNPNIMRPDELKEGSKVRIC